MESEALSISQNIKFKRGIADAYNVLGAREWYIDDYPGSIDDYTNNAEKIEEEIDYKDGLATSLDGIGEINSENQDYSSAILKFNKAMKIFSELKDTKDVGDVLEDISECYINKNSFDSALMFAEKSLKIGESLNNASTIVNALNDIGKCYAFKNEYKNSMEIFSRMRSMIDTMASKDDPLMDYYRGITNGLLNLRKYNEAIDSANKKFGNSKKNSAR